MVAGATIRDEGRFLGQKCLGYIYKLVGREAVNGMRMKIEEGVNN